MCCVCAMVSGCVWMMCCVWEWVWICGESFCKWRWCEEWAVCMRVHGSSVWVWGVCLTMWIRHTLSHCQQITQVSLWAYCYILSRLVLLVLGGFTTVAIIWYYFCSELTSFVRYFTLPNNLIPTVVIQMVSVSVGRNAVYEWCLRVVCGFVVCVWVSMLCVHVLMSAHVMHVRKRVGECACKLCTWIQCLFSYGLPLTIFTLQVYELMLHLLQLQAVCGGWGACRGLLSGASWSHKLINSIKA